MHVVAPMLASASVVAIIVISTLNVADGKGLPLLVEYDGTEYQGSYLITGNGNGTLLNVSAENLSIRTTIQSEFDAQLIIILPKQLLNATHIPYYPNGTKSGISEYARVPGIIVDGLKTENYTSLVSQSVISFRVPGESGVHEIKILVTAVPIVLSSPIMRGTSLDHITTATVGQIVIIGSSFTNTESTELQFVMLTEARNEAGITVFLGIYWGKLNSGGSTDIGLRWAPEEPGRYELRSFLISGYRDSAMLSAVTVGEAVIEESRQ